MKCHNCGKIKKDMEKFNPLLHTIKEMGYKIDSFSYYTDRDTGGITANIGIKV